MMKASNRWVGVLGAAVMLSAAGVVASSLTDNTYYEGCDMDLYANGDCNMKNNDPECGRFYFLVYYEVNACRRSREP